LYYLTTTNFPKNTTIPTYKKQTFLSVLNKATRLDTEPNRSHILLLYILFVVILCLISFNITLFVKPKIFTWRWFALQKHVPCLWR